MLEFRKIKDEDVPLVENWLNKEHVKKWYDIPHLGVAVSDWIDEISARNGEFRWLTHLIVLWHGQPIGLCQYYKCTDSDEDFGAMPLAGTYGIDYLIGEESHLGKGIGRGLITLLVDTIFSLPGAERVTADIDEENKASEKALLSCGFELADADRSRFVIHKNDWMI